ncbi:MAG: hypothetical protein JXO72_12865 [Vicinamibacteria bacterium]|nr:hypothetical protein [Vicinamibacteria bacterium]
MSKRIYYYAGGQKVAIDLDEEHVCVDLARVENGPPALREWLKRENPKPLPGRLALVDRGDVPEEILKALDERSALQSVYRHGDALIVVLPEVRIEVDEKQRRRLSTFAARGPAPAVIESDKAGSLVMRPLSGKGADALALANSLHEKLNPPLAQARFLRITRKPGRPSRR